MDRPLKWFYVLNLLMPFLFRSLVIKQRGKKKVGNNAKIKIFLWQLVACWPMAELAAFIWESVITHLNKTWFLLRRIDRGKWNGINQSWPRFFYQNPITSDLVIVLNIIDTLSSISIREFIDLFDWFCNLVIVIRKCYCHRYLHRIRDLLSSNLSDLGHIELLNYDYKEVHFSPWIKYLKNTHYYNNWMKY